jgi:predicted ribosomally synthesized peptide with SipW-like signal peptide
MTRKSFFVGGLLTLILTAAVVGGSFAIFTDTDSAHVKFEAGTIKIELSGEVYTETELNPNGFDDWKPGDYDEFALNIKNVGNNKAWIQLYIYETPPWDEGKLNFWDVAKWGVTDDANWNKWVLAANETMQLKLWVDLPQWAGNEYQGAQGDLLILVVAKQWRNKYGEYECVALEDKDSSWLPILGNDLEGIVCYKVEGDKLLVDVNSYGLIPGEYYQLSLNGTGGGPSCDNFEDVSFAEMTTSLYHSGWYYYDGMVLHDTCTEDWHEGVYNFIGTDGEVQAKDPDGDGLGSISWGGEITGLPSGDYDKVKFLVKHITGYADPPPGPGDYGTSWIPVLMEMDYLNFTIP